MVAEKILGPDEPLPPEWPVAGTTGYDFLNLVNRLLVDRAGLAEIAKVYHRFTAERTDFRERLAPNAAADFAGSHVE